MSGSPDTVGAAKREPPAGGGGQAPASPERGGLCVQTSFLPRCVHAPRPRTVDAAGVGAFREERGGHRHDGARRRTGPVGDGVLAFPVMCHSPQLPGQMPAHPRRPPGLRALPEPFGRRHPPDCLQKPRNLESPSSRRTGHEGGVKPAERLQDSRPVMLRSLGPLRSNRGPAAQPRWLGCWALRPRGSGPMLAFQLLPLEEHAAFPGTKLLGPHIQAPGEGHARLSGPGAHP